MILPELFMPISVKRKTVAAAEPTPLTQFTMEHQRTTGPYDNINIMSDGVRIGQLTLMHNADAKRFVRLVQSAGVTVTVDKDPVH